MTISESEWARIGKRIDNRIEDHRKAFIHTPLVDTPPPTVPPTTTTRTPSGPVNVKEGDRLLQNLAIQADKPYKMDNGVFAGGQGISCSNTNKLEAHNVGVKSYRYGIWVDCQETILTAVDVESFPSGAGDGDDYCARGSTDRWCSDHCTFKNSGGKGVLRIYDCPDFQSTDDSFNGGRLMLGGGTQNEWDNEKQFNGTLTRAKISVKSVQVYSASVVMFDTCDFAGTPELFCEGTAVLKGCTNIPATIKPVGAQVTIQP